MIVVNAVTGIIPNSMVVDYIRVRKSNIKELQELIEQRQNSKLMWIAILAIPALVLAVAVIGLLTTL